MLNKYLLNKRYLVFAIVIVIAVIASSAAILSKFKADDTNVVSVSLTSAQSSYNIGEEITVWANVSAPIQLAAIEVNINFDPSFLEYQSMVETADFDSMLEAKTAPGMIHAVRGKFGGATGSLVALGVKFKAVKDGNTGLNLQTTTCVGTNGESLATVFSGLSLVLQPILGQTSTPEPEPSVPAPEPVSEPDPGAPVTSEPANNSNQSVLPSTPRKTVALSSQINTKNSSVSFDKTEAISDGKDKICASIKILDSKKKVITTIKPLITVTASDLMAIEKSGDGWIQCFTSTQSGEKNVTVKAQGIIIKQQTVFFQENGLPIDTESLVIEKSEDGSEVPAFTDPVKDPIKAVLSSVKGDVFSMKGEKTITDRDRVAVVGNADPSSDIIVYIHSPKTVSKKVTVGKDGRWKVVTDEPLDAGAHRVEVAVAKNYDQESQTRTIATFEVKKAKLPMIWRVILVFVVAALLVILVIRKKSKMIPSGMPNNVPPDIPLNPYN